MSEITCQNSCHDDNFCLLGDHPTCKYKQTMNQPNQPPKSAEEFIKEHLYKAELYEDVKVLANLMELYASQFARYVTDEEIDAMFPLSDPNKELTFHLLHTNWINTYKSQAAKAMRDKIFNNVKPKV